MNQISRNVIRYTKVYELKMKYPWADENQMLEIVFGLKND
jgi:hypothetical protein